jgi:hypothetical protein
MAFKMKGSAFKLNNVATKSALKQEGPVTEQNIKAQKSEEERDPWIVPDKGFGDDDFVSIERMNDYVERIDGIKQDAMAAGKELSAQQKKDIQKLSRELAIMRKRYKNLKKKK